MRVAFAGLWTQCDRAGRFQWRPRQLKSQILPYDSCDFSRVLDALATRGFIVKYASSGDEFGYIPTWNRHQIINPREKASTLPQPTKDEELRRVDDACPTRDDALTQSAAGKGKEGKGKEGESRVLNASKPLPPSPGANGEFMAATALLQDCEIASTANDIRVIAQVIQFEAKNRGIEGAVSFLKGEVTEARSRGEPVTVFWLKDRKYLVKEKDEYQRYLESPA